MLLRSCCCCDLRGGAWAVAIVFLSLSVLQLLGVLIGWGHADAYSAWDGGTFWKEGVAYLVPLTICIPLQLTIDALLLRSVYISLTRPKSALRDVKCWLVFRAVMFGLVSLGNFGLIVSAVIMRYTGRERESVMYGGIFVATAIIGILFWYAWVVVLSFYWQLRDSAAGGAPACGDTVQLQTAAAGRRPETARPAEPSAPLMAGDGPRRDQGKCQKCACAV